MRRYNRELPVPMTETEKVEKGEVLAKLELEVADAEAEIANVKATAKHDLKILSDTVGGKINSIRRLAREVESGEEFRTVAVQERLSENSSEVETVRTDTGEVVDIRAAAEEDRQASFGELIDETLGKVADETEAAEALEEQDEAAEVTEEDVAASKDLEEVDAEFSDEDDTKGGEVSA